LSPPTHSGDKILRDHDPYGIVGRLLAGLPSGSYLVVAHAASDLAPEAAAEMTRRNNQTSPVPITPRTQAEVTRSASGTWTTRWTPRSAAWSATSGSAGSPDASSARKAS